MYIGITGTFAAGKGEVVAILRKYGFTRYGFGDFLRAELAKRGMDTSIATTTKFANSLREEHGDGYLAEQLLERLESEAPKHAVLESIRHPAELAVLRRLPGFILLSVDAPRELRYERLQQRGRSDNLKTFEEFCYWEDKQLEGKGSEQQLYAVMDEADVHLMNIGTIDELEMQLKDALQL